MGQSTELRCDLPACYRIYLKGVLDASWSDSLQGMTILTSQRADGVYTTTLTGELIDQAALMGVLNLVYDLGLILLAVDRVPPMRAAASGMGATG